MNQLLIYVLESSVCLGVFYLFYVMVLHDQPSHQYNRFYLLATSFLSFVLPLLEVPILSTEGVGKVAGNYQHYILLDPAFLSGATTEISVLSWLFQWQNALMLLYGFGILLSLILFVKQISQLTNTVRKNKITPRKDYWLVYTQGKLPTSSCFGYLFWDNTQALTRQEAAQIIAHEEAHIRQKHSYDVFYMAVLKILFWFHPLVYLYERALTDVHEFAADASALRQQNPKSYAQLLTRHLFDGLQLSLVNHFYKSQTLKRIKMMQVINQKTPKYKMLLAIPLLLALFFTFSCQPDEEEMEKQAIAATYEDVQAQMKEVGVQHNALILKYFETQPKFYKSLNQEAKKSDSNSLSEDELSLIVFKEVASSSDYNKFAELVEQKNALQEKLMSLPDADNIFMVVEDQPEPEGGIKEFYSYIAQNMKYPVQARQKGIEGKVFLQFVVNEYGELTEFKSLKGIGAGCDAEAIRVLESAPAWNPGTTDGKPVKVRMVMPITFKLDKGDDNVVEKKASEELGMLEHDHNKQKEITLIAYIN